MKLQRSTHWMFGWALALALITPATAGSRPPAGSKPLSEILQGIEQRAGEVVFSADFSSGSWEILACKAGGQGCREIEVDPQTGEERSSSPEDTSDALPPSNGKTASQIARSIEGRNLGVIAELEYDDPQWEAQIRPDRGHVKLYVDPISAEVRRCVGHACTPRGR
ncbi:PepSY domain-containing protein [Lamprocystis purpurea]|uniref:PepSY domain-containing protein n=1 Tax=Lamprocystis purpurea TaxID=61598 RepID=UPI0003A93CCD|nr:PepSY domain-containing protein [Lamprocystis purpurea]